MGNLLLSIACGTAVILIFRILQNSKVPAFPAIVFNYWICVIVGATVEPEILQFDQVDTGSGWLYMAALLGTMFILGFYVMHLTVAHAGITAASIASKNAMVISVTAAFFLYQDEITFLKILGIILAVVAIAMASIKRKEDPHALGTIIIYPILVFVISGAIETLIKYSQHHLMDDTFHNRFTSYLFGTAAIWGSLLLLGQRMTGRVKNVDWRKVGWGALLLGIPNFGSIFFLIRTLDQPGWESSVVYPVHNMAVVLVAAISARAFFHERISWIKLSGIILALIAIGLLLISTFVIDGS